MGKGVMEGLGRAFSFLRTSSKTCSWAVHIGIALEAIEICY